MRHSSRLKRNTALMVLSGLLALAVTVWLAPVQAAQLQSRSLIISTSKASTAATHTVQFNFPSTAAVGSLKLEYCTSPLQAIACNAPPGLNAAVAVLASQNGETGFSVLVRTANTITLSRSVAATGTQQNTYVFNSITNPSGIGPFYLRISSFPTTDATGAAQDFGATVGVVTQGITITTEVPPILNFCAGVVAVPPCSTSGGHLVKLGGFSASRASTGTSQFIVGTNAQFGYAVRVDGNTMTSGNNIIKALAAPAASSPGSPQFGINLVANTSPAVGADPNGGSGSVLAGYNKPNRFKYAGGSVLALGGSPSENEVYTVSYLVNIGKNQPVGVYNTTLTYTVTATF